MKKEESRHNSKKTRTVNYIVHIDFDKNYGSGDLHLLPNGTYQVYSSDSNDGFNNVSYSEILQSCTDEIESWYKHENFSFLTPLPVNSLMIEGIYSGSIEIVITVVFKVVSFVSKIKALSESIELLRSFINGKISEHLARSYGGILTVTTKSTTTKSTHSNRSSIPNTRKLFPIRDGFFWYLFISHFVLIAVIVFFIIKAVVKLYGW
jgi:hypothetical protein